jgi:hypothetical protein
VPLTVRVSVEPAVRRSEGGTTEIVSAGPPTTVMACCAVARPLADAEIVDVPARVSR